MTAPASTPPDLMRLAKEALQLLTSQGVPPVPANYEHFFLQAARKNGAPPALLERLKVPRPAPDAAGPPDEKRVVITVLELSLRVGIADDDLPTAVRSLFRRVLKLARTNRLDRREGEVMSALQAAARRSLSGQHDFDPDDLLRAPTPSPSGTPVVEVGGPVALRVLKLVLKVIVAQGRRPGNTPEEFAKILKIVESGRLPAMAGDVVAHLRRICKESGADRALTGVDDPQGGEVAQQHSQLETANDALRAACLALLELIEPAISHSERDAAAVDVLRKHIRSDGGAESAAAVAADAQKLQERLLRYFAAIPEQRKQVKDLIGVVMQTLRTASRGSDDFAGRLQRFEKQVEKADNPEELLAMKEAILKESQSLGHDIVHMKERFESVNDTVRKAHAQIARLQTELNKTRSLSLMDPLTGIPNRRGFDDWVDRVLKTEDGKFVPFCFMVFDVDHFKRVNDTYGHMAGDQVLREVARRIAGAIRDGDFCSRFGGEEFCLALPGASLKEAVRVAVRILDKIRADGIDIGTSQITVNASVGASEYKEGERLEDTFERADRALYMAKQTGRNRCCSEEDLAAAAPSSFAA